MVCQKCGFQNPDNAKCCCGCGKKLVEEPKKNNIWIPIAAVAVLTCVIIAAIMFAIPEKKEGWYVNEDGSHSYYIDNKMSTGMHEIDGDKYFFDDLGIMHEGLLHLNNKLYFFNDDGVMETGFIQVETESTEAELPDAELDWITENLDSVYYFGDDGVALTGWQSLDGNKYYFDQNGKMAVGKRQIGENLYYFDKDGVMATGEYKLDDSRTASFDEDGVYQHCVKTEKLVENEDYIKSSNKTRFSDTHGKSDVYYVILNEPVEDCISITVTVDLHETNYTKSDGDWRLHIFDEDKIWKHRGIFQMDGDGGTYTLNFDWTESFTRVACARYGGFYSNNFDTYVESITYYCDF